MALTEIAKALLKENIMLQKTYSPDNIQNKMTEALIVLNKAAKLLRHQKNLSMRENLLKNLTSIEEQIKQLENDNVNASDKQEQAGCFFMRSISLVRQSLAIVIKSIENLCKRKQTIECIIMWSSFFSISE